ncbi:unnamed protein product [Oreochromis niloticus]|nr:unnamed protein product [Mustela putorius furo]
MTGDLKKKDCTTTFNNADFLQSTKYYFRLECSNALKYIFSQAGVDISFIDVPPSPTLIPSTLEVKEGTSVSLTCSAPAPCWSHPPALTWSPNLGQSQETVQGNQDKTKVKTSVISFTASHLHHGNKISCTAVYQKQDGSPDVTAERSLTPDISFLPQILFSSDCVKTASQVNCSCDTEGNPSPAVQWYLNGEPVNQSGGFEIFSETLNITVHRSSFILSQPQVKHFSTLLCRSFNSLGSASQQFCMSKFKSSAEPQGSEMHCGLYSGVVLWVLAGVFFSVSVICAACLCKAQKNVKPKEEDRTYMSLSGRTVSSSEYDVINTAPKSQ